MERKDINLQAYLAEYLAAQAQSVATLGPLFEEAIAAGKAIILFDGLDEVQSKGAALVQRMETFASEAVGKGNRVAVTSRIVGYRDAPVNLKHWALYTLFDFTDEDIDCVGRKVVPGF